MVIGLERGADDLHIVNLMPLPPHPLPSSFVSLKSRMVLPFWFLLTQVVSGKRLLNECSFGMYNLQV